MTDRFSLPARITLALLGVVSPTRGVAYQETTPPPTPPASAVVATPTPQCKGRVVGPVLVHKVNADYSATLREQKVQGAVILSGIITTGGSVEDIKVVKSPSIELTKLAIAAFRQWRYKPALCDDKPVPVQITTTMTFSLHG